MNRATQNPLCFAVHPDVDRIAGAVTGKAGQSYLCRLSRTEQVSCHPDKCQVSRSRVCICIHGEAANRHVRAKLCRCALVSTMKILVKMAIARNYFWGKEQP
jgi:hypothetical protein